MKQWLVRGLLATLPAGTLALACSSEPLGPSSDKSEPGVGVDGTDGTNATKATEAASQIAATTAARSRLARLAQFARPIAVAKSDKDGAAPAKGPGRSAEVSTELRAVVQAGEAERFLKQGGRVRAEISEALKRGAVGPASVDLPLTAEGFVRIQADKARAGIEFAALGVKPGVPLEHADGLVSYAAAAPGGGDMVLRVGRESVEDFIVLEQKPANAFVDYKVKVGEIAGLRLYANMLEFLDKDGDPQVGVSPPELVDADGVAHRARLKLTDCAFDSSPQVPWGRPVTAPGATECTLRIEWDDAKVTYPAIVDPVWTTPGAMKTARFRNAGVKQALNGFVLTCGGLDINGDSLNTCEAFNPAGNAGAGSWAVAPTMTSVRNKFTLLALGNDVLAVGDTTKATSELLNVAGGSWAATGTDFSTGSFYLNSLQPALTGDGVYVVVVDNNGKAFYYDVAAKKWTAGASTASARYGYQVLAVPGLNSVMRCGGTSGSTAYKTCEKYTPSTNTWILPGAMGAADDMNAARTYAAWATIDATKVMVYGGYNTTSGTYLTSAEVYNSTNNTWTNNTTLITQSIYESEMHNTWAPHTGSSKILSTANYYPYIYDPATQAWTQMSTYDGTSSFYTMSSDGAVVSVGSRVILFPVSSNGSNSAQSTCKIFDFVSQGGTCNYTTDCRGGLTCVYDSYNNPDGFSVCCDTACSDPCSSCRASLKESGKDEGTCGPREHTKYVGSACPYSDSTTCGNSGYYCDGKGACAKWDTSTQCVASTCSGAAPTTTQNNTRYCDGKGACAAGGTTTCNTGYACVSYGASSGACVTSCGSDSDCATNYYCQYWASPFNTCQPRKSAGKTCNGAYTNAECASGYCVDGVCCDKACNGTCEGCSNALTGKTNGVCSAIPAGQASGNDCYDQGPGTCSFNGLCSGTAGVCQKYVSGTQCGDIGACASETSRYVPDTCDGSGSCVDKGTAACLTGYACQLGVCQTTCTTDAQCASAYSCDTTTKTCVVDRKQGQSCTKDSACEGNANCVDGVCCDSACVGTCRSCLKNRTGLSSDGICGDTLDDTDPENECAKDVAYPTSCKAPGLCDGTGACRVYAKQGTVAVSPDSCVGGTLTVTTCDGAGNQKAQQTACYPYKCNAGGTACRVACTVKADCDDSSFCANGFCVGQKPQGASCADGNECKSGFCVDQGVGALEGEPDTGGGEGGAGPDVDHPGVCCDKACGNPCEACKKSIKGQGSDGTCGFVKDHTDPADDCPVDDQNSCGLSGECNGAGACRNVPAGTACGATSCVGNAVQGQRCDGQGACIDNDGTTACAPYVCKDVDGAFQCTNPCVDDNDCADGYFCTEQACKKKLAFGSECTTNGICNSGFCVDGVCCDSSCNGQCAACDNPGSEGTCSAVKGEPHGNRTACDHAGEECGGSCDGVNTTACKYVANGTTCGETTCDNGIAQSSECNGQGECRSNKNVECSPYVCGPDDACLERCEQDADCSQGYACDETTQRCLPSAVAAKCSDDRQYSEGQNGTTPCKPFLCVPASGTCAFSCAFTTDCAPDFVCEPSTKTCLPAPTDTGGGDDESCACRAAGATSSSQSGYLALVAFGLALGGLRRRRSNRPSPPRAQAARVSHLSE